LTTTTRGAPAALAVIVPAHNEELLVRQCLESVRVALANSGLPSVIVLVAHRCTDRTVELARNVLSGPGELVVLDNSPTVATARAAGVTHALAAMAAWPTPRPSAEQCWLLSTDADSVVPPTWVADLYRHLDSGAAAVAGLVDVQGWEGASPSAREAYRAILAAGMRLTQHDHAYAANLAVRLDAYLDVGGWPNHVPGEDAALLAALRARGWPVVGARDVRVRTSGRRVPRAGGGLGSLLDRLATEKSASADPKQSFSALRTSPARRIDQAG
jgi:cellulose synthase/poly-beta-1,6-N-acetylglucosamine synthase-like glycosyltransferase